MKPIVAFLLTLSLVSLSFNPSGSIRFTYNDEEIDYTKGIVLRKDGQLELVNESGLVIKTKEVLVMMGKRICYLRTSEGEWATKPIKVGDIMNSCSGIKVITITLNGKLIHNIKVIPS